MRIWPAVAFVLFLSSCKDNNEKVLISSELNTIGNKHIIQYDKQRPVRIEYNTFIGSFDKDSTGVDSLIRKDIDSIVYGPENKTVRLIRVASRHSVHGKRDFRKYYFNDDGLLVRITRFNGDKEYITDSVKYDYPMQRASFYDLVNKQYNELEYDKEANITSNVEKRIADQYVIQTTYYYYDTSSQDPFLMNLDDSELLFGCFRSSTVGLFWNSATQPLFSSKNNVQAIKQVRGKEESNGLYEYQYKDGVPSVRYGGYGVIYYRYAKNVPVE